MVWTMLVLLLPTCPSREARTCCMWTCSKMSSRKSFWFLSVTEDESFVLHGWHKSLFSYYLQVNTLAYPNSSKLISLFVSTVYIAGVLLCSDRRRYSCWRLGGLHGFWCEGNSFLFVCSSTNATDWQCMVLSHWSARQVVWAFPVPHA